MIIDAHQHFLNLDRIKYAFLKPELKEIYRSFEPTDLKPYLDKHKINKTIVVQAQNAPNETDYLLEVAQETDWIGGVVGWVPLNNPVEANRKLHQLVQHPKLKGIRHLLFFEEEDWIVSEEVLEGLHILSSYRLPFEMSAEFPKHLHYVKKIKEKVPELKIVIDHLAKPPIQDGKIDSWGEQIREVAQSPGVFAKISGLNTAANPINWNGETLKPYIELAINAFGAERLMFGSDWPVANLAGNYDQVWDATHVALKERTEEEKKYIFGLTAANVYKIDTY